MKYPIYRGKWKRNDVRRHNRIIYSVSFIFYKGLTKDD